MARKPGFIFYLYQWSTAYARVCHCFLFNPSSVFSNVNNNFSKSLKLCGHKLCFYYAFIYNENILSLGLLHSPALWIALARQEMHNKVAKPSSNGSQSFLPQTCSAWNLNLLFPEPLFYLPYIWVTQRIITFCKSELSSLLSMQQWQKACLPHSLPCLNFFCAHIPTVLRDYWSRSAVMALHVQLCWHWSYLK